MLELVFRRLISGLALLSSVACVEAGRGAVWPESEAVLAIAFAKPEQGPMRPLGAPIPRGDPGWGELSWPLRVGEELVLLFLDHPALEAMHPLLDLERLGEARVLPPDLECARRSEPDGRAVANFPDRTIVFEETAGSLVAVVDPSELLDEAGSLSVLLSDQSCSTGLRAQRFGDEWFVLAETMEVQGQVYRRDTQEALDVFALRMADYIDEDHVVIAASSGLGVLRRGEILSSDTGPFFVSPRQTTSANYEYAGCVGVAVQPERDPSGVTRIGASFAFIEGGSLWGLLATFDLDDAGLHLVQTTTTAGFAEQFTVDAEGRLIALSFNQDDSAVRGRVIGILGDGDRFELYTIDRALARIVATSVADPPHLLLAQDGAIYAGDVLAPVATWVPLRGTDGGVRIQRSLATVHGGERLHMFGGTDSGEIERFEEATGWTISPAFLDREVLATPCHGVPDACGNVGVAPETLELWATQDALGPQLIVAPTRCTVAVAARTKDSCYGLLDVGQQPRHADRGEPPLRISGNRQFDRALVIGGSGTLFEVVHTP